ncbi:Pyridoxamine 5'-phosphate oxidase [uncultured archaeon]|nr:Pyridoxamine 5'-phosphate oxidase [uncultured archaeon]
MKTSEFLKFQKILRLATIDSKNNPHIVPVWYEFRNKKFYVGTNTRTKKAKNVKKNPKVSFCVDVGIKSPNIFGVMCIGKARLILEKNQVSVIAKRILKRYFKSLKTISAQELLNDTNCIIEISPRKTTVWKF